MANNVKLIYDLIQKDLKAKGWEDDAIAVAVAECQQERQASSADEHTICVKEISYLSQESLQKVAILMDEKNISANILVKLKKWIVKLGKALWRLNWEAIIGVLFLIPPIWGAIAFILNLFDAGIGIDFLPESWNYISTTSADNQEDFLNDGLFYSNLGHSEHMRFVWLAGNKATPAIPLYLGLMAMAGAYLIKGNLRKK